MPGRNWSLLFDTRVLPDGSEVRAPASPLPELAVEIGGVQDLDWDVSLPSSPTSTQPLTSALSKSSCESPVAAASPVWLVLPRAKVVLQRLAVQLPASQVLKLCDESLKILISHDLILFSLRMIHFLELLLWELLVSLMAPLMV